MVAEIVNVACAIRRVALNAHGLAILRRTRSVVGVKLHCVGLPGRSLPVVAYFVAVVVRTARYFVLDDLTVIARRLNDEAVALWNVLAAHRNEDWDSIVEQDHVLISLDVRRIVAKLDDATFPYRRCSQQRDGQYYQDDWNEEKSGRDQHGFHFLLSVKCRRWESNPRLA